MESPAQPEESAEDDLDRVVARLDALVDWERRDRAAGMRVDLEPARALQAALGRPDGAFRTVHVAGSKGKGSTVAWLEAALLHAGHRVGAYTSPHVESIVERVRIGGRAIEREAFARALARALACARPDVPEATWFDVVTLGAFEALREARVDWGLIEVGLGGRLDTTNVVLPELCVLTSIELEHTAVLGSTRAAIAAEKAGIAKPDVPLVCGLDPGDPAAAVVAQRAREVGAPLVFAPPSTADSMGQRNRRLAMVAIAVLAERAKLDELGPELLCDLQPTALPGRMERRALDGVPVVLDGAHTPESLGLVLAELARAKDLPGRPTVVLGVGRDKQLASLLKLVAETADALICSSSGTGLALPASDVAQAAREAGLEVETASDPWAAVQRASVRAKGSWVLVTGSLHLVGHVRRHLSPS